MQKELELVKIHIEIIKTKAIKQIILCLGAVLWAISRTFAQNIQTF